MQGGRERGREEGRERGREREREGGRKKKRKKTERASSQYNTFSVCVCSVGIKVCVVPYHACSDTMNVKCNMREKEGEKPCNYTSLVASVPILWSINCK